MEQEKTAVKAWNLKVKPSLIALAEAYCLRERHQRGRKGFHPSRLIEIAIPQWIEEHDPLPRDTGSNDEIDSLTERLKKALSVIEEVAKASTRKGDQKLAIRKKPPIL